MIAGIGVPAFPVLNPSHNFGDSNPITCDARAVTGFGRFVLASVSLGFASVTTAGCDPDCK